MRCKACPNPLRILRKMSSERLTFGNRVEELCNNFESYLFNLIGLIHLLAPSVYFHSRTLERLKTIGLSKALEDTYFFEYLYATLTSWGMHRMGPKGAKLV